MSNDSSVSFLVLAIIIATLVVCFFGYSAIIGMIIKRKNKKHIEENIKILSRVTLESLVILDLLLTLNQQMLANFVPASNNVKMSHIQERAKRVLEFFFTKNKYWFGFLLENKKIEEPIKMLTHKLYETKSNLWEKHLTLELKQLRFQVEIVRVQERGKWQVANESLKETIQKFYHEKTTS